MRTIATLLFLAAAACAETPAEARKHTLESEDPAMRREMIERLSRNRDDWKGIQLPAAQSQAILAEWFPKEKVVELRVKVLEGVGNTQRQQPKAAAWAGFAKFMLEAAKDNTAAVREAAARELGGQPWSAEVTAALTALAKTDKEIAVRAAAIRALSYHAGKDAASVAMLYAMLACDSEPLEVRKSCLEALFQMAKEAGKRSPERSLALAAEALAMPEPEMRMAALPHLNFVFREDVRALAPVLKSLSDKDGDVRASAAHFLYPMHYMDRKKGLFTKELANEAAAKLRAMLEDPVRNVRAEAMHSLAQVDPDRKGAAKAIAAQMKDDSTATRIAAVHSLAMMGKDAGEILPELVEMRKAFGDSSVMKARPALMEALERAIKQIGGEERLKAVLAEIKRS